MGIVQTPARSPIELSRRDVTRVGNNGVLDGVTLCRSQVPARCCFEKSDLASTMPRSTLEGVQWEGIESWTQRNAWICGRTLRYPQTCVVDRR